MNELRQQQTNMDIENPVFSINPAEITMTPEQLHVAKWPNYEQVFHQVLRDHPAVGDPYNFVLSQRAQGTPVDTTFFTPDYERNVADPARRLNKSIKFIFDLRGPPDKHPGLSNIDTISDIINAHYPNLETGETPEVTYQMIQSACQHLELTQGELSVLDQYAERMRISDSLENKIKELQEKARDIRASGIGLIQDHKSKRYQQAT